LTLDHPVNSDLSVANQGGKLERAISPGLVLKKQEKVWSNYFRFFLMKILLLLENDLHALNYEKRK